MTNKRILVTGGTGFIGSHTVVLLLEQGYDVIIFDNLSNSKLAVVEDVESITQKKLSFICGDITNPVDLDSCFSKNKIDAVLHFAGLKSVADSVKQPLKYYSVNVTGTLNLLKAMSEANVTNFIFSSSATVYGNDHLSPLKEDLPFGAPQSPYGHTKLSIERILQQLWFSDNRWKIGTLRYFNPVGAHPSAMLGEQPVGIPNNLMPYIARVASGEFEVLKIFGGDYPNYDGTGVRDFIHVMDLANGHIQLLKNLTNGCQSYNLGTGQGTSVLELVQAFEAANNVSIPYEIVERRPGDVASSYANVDKAANILGWKATLSVTEMCRDAWRWQKRVSGN